MQQFDVFVSGSGPAGQRAAVQAAERGTPAGRSECTSSACCNDPTFAECDTVAALDGYDKVGPAASDDTPPPEHASGVWDVSQLRRETPSA